jgi:hypothetical protein
METQEVQAEVQNQQESLAYQPENQQESLQSAENPFKVRSISIPDYDIPPQEGEVPQEEYVEPVAQEDAPQVEDIESLRAKLAEMEEKLQASSSAQPTIQYRLPDEVNELLDNPAILQMLNENFESKSVLDLIKDAFKEANPWAKTDRHIEAHLRRQYPDIDFDIPENLGLAEEDYDAIAWQAEGIRQNLIAQQQEVRGKLEAARNPQTADFDIDGYQQQYESIVEGSLKDLKPMEMSLGIPGYNLPKVDAEKIRDIVYSDAVPLSLDKNGNVWPNVKAAAAMAELEMLKSQIPAMLEAARRAAPKEAVEAINRTLNNQVPQNNVSPIDPKQVMSAKGPTVGGLRIVGVQSNF